MSTNPDTDSHIGKVVMVTTGQHKGVFAGTLLKRDKEKGTCTLKGARMAVYWSESVRGVLGLASTGPDKGCKISPAVPEIELDSVSAYVLVPDSAWAKWEAAPWAK